MAGSDTCSIYVFDAYGTLFDVHAAVRRYSDKTWAECGASFRNLAIKTARV